MLYEKWNYVLAIAEEQNLTRAAKRLFISQPALTLYLNRLEKELGVKLFDRSRTPILLTEAGKYYVEQTPVSPLLLLHPPGCKRPGHPGQGGLHGTGSAHRAR